MQEARKTSGLQVTDRVALRWEADGELAEALREHAALVAGEVLATTYEEGLAGDRRGHRLGPGRWGCASRSPVRSSEAGVR